MKLISTRVARLAHKWLALFIGFQFFIWVLGGAVFVILPHSSIIKGKGVLNTHIESSHEASNLYPLYKILKKYPNAKSVKSLYIGDLPVYKVYFNQGNKTFNATNGNIINKVTKKQIINYSNIIYIGSGKIQSSKLLTGKSAKIVSKLQMIPGDSFWQVKYNDIWGSRLYFKSDTGEFIKIRNTPWIIYDFLFRLHIMDYSFTQDKDLNNWLVRIVVIFALLLVISGLYLTIKARYRKQYSKKR